MDKYELVLKDIKAILETIDEVNLVSHGKPVSIDLEDTFTSIYISPELDRFDSYKLGTGTSSYNNTFFIQLNINVDCSADDLLWVVTRRKVIDAMLDDTAIWSNIVDRDVVSIAYDDYVNYPRRALAILFEFKIREDTII